MPKENKGRQRYRALQLDLEKRVQGHEYDEEAEAALEDRRIVRDLASNPQTKFLTHLVPLGPRVWLLFRKAHTGRLGMWLELPESITLHTITKHWEDIRQWQDFLRDSQGPDLNGTEQYVNILNERKKGGISYNALRLMVAEEALYMIYWLLAIKKPFAAALKRLSKWSANERQRRKGECGVALEKFRMAGGRNEVKIAAWWEAALKHIASNKKRPLNAEVPVTKQNVIDTIKAFRKRYENHHGVEESH